MTTIIQQDTPTTIKAEAIDGAGNYSIHEITVQPFAQPPAVPEFLEPIGMIIDRHYTEGVISNLNGILEPVETILIEPMWLKTNLVVLYHFKGMQYHGQVLLMLLTLL